MTSLLEEYFKGWRKPGPIPPGARDEVPPVEAGETLDAISGHFRIFQLANGHRFSTDDVLTAWYATSWCPTASKVLELGSGIGTVGLITAWRLPGATFVTVEAQQESVRLARKSIQWNGLQDRFTVREGDFRESAVLGDNEKFDLILGSPPYFPLGTGIEGDHPQKIACRFETRGDISDYCAVAARHLSPGGWFFCVFPVAPPEQEQRVRTAAQNAGLSIVRFRKVILREPERPLLGLFALVRNSDLPDAFRNISWEEPPLIIRTATGAVHPEYSAIKLSFGFPP